MNININIKKEYCVPTVYLLAFAAGEMITTSGEKPAVLTSVSTGDGDNWDW